jgi:hypothetical protein
VWLGFDRSNTNSDTGGWAGLLAFHLVPVALCQQFGTFGSTNGVPFSGPEVCPLL